MARRNRVSAPCRRVFQTSADCSRHLGEREKSKAIPSPAEPPRERVVRLRGPDDIELLLEPYSDGFVWKIRNGSLRAIENLGVEIVEVRTFDAAKAAFRYDGVKKFAGLGCRFVSYRQVRSQPGQHSSLSRETGCDSAKRLT